MHALPRAFVCSLCLASAFAVSALPAFGKDQPSARQSGRLESLDGFRNIKFGAAVADIPGLTIEQDHGDEKLYVMKGEDLAFGPAKLDTIVYHFFRGKLYAVSLHTEAKDDSLYLLRTAQKAFGVNSSGDETLDEAWEGKLASAIFTMNPKTDQGELLLINNATAAEVEKHLEEQINDAVKAL